MVLQRYAINEARGSTIVDMLSVKFEIPLEAFIEI